jgi:hypothetical protein
MTQTVQLVGRSDVVFEVFMDGMKRGELRLSKGGIDWWPRKAKTNVKTKTWTQLADFLES